MMVTRGVANLGRGALRLRSVVVCLTALFAFALMAGAGDYPSADTDVYGNAIYTNDTGAVSYQFIVSGGLQSALSQANSASLTSNEDVALDAVFKSVRATDGGPLYSTKFVGLFILIR